MSETKSSERRKEDAAGDWDGWGDYMTVKKQKLTKQFELEEKCEATSKIFNGVAIYVNGYTVPSADVLRRLIIQNGGQYHTYCSNSRTTHTVATNLPRSKIVQLKPTDKVVRPEWITDSLKEGRLLPDVDYLLYSTSVKTVDQYVSKSDNNQQQTSKAKREKEANVRIPTATDAKDPNFINNYYARSRLHMISTWCQEMKDFVKHLQQTNDGRYEGRQKIAEYLASKNCDADDIVDNVVKIVGDNDGNVYTHLDMDCFFVSVGLRERPSLRGLPVAVTHSKGKGPTAEFTSHSEIASCSYEARKCGVKNGMWLGDALKLCPDIKTIPYDFEKYKTISKQLYEIVASYTLNIKAISCDELYVDFTELCRETGAAPLDIATVIRKEIFDTTGCPASCGIGPNILVARLATRKAKPNGQFYVTEENVTDFMKSQKISDLPGVGRSTTEKLGRLKILTCADLASVPLKVLQKDFGPKTGQHLYDFARGIDHRKINDDSENVVRKSVSCDVNYGIRFTEFDELAKFLDDLSKEVSRRLKTAKMNGRTICLKCLIRCPDTPVTTVKFLGHGIVNSSSKSVTLHQATSDCEIIFRETLALFKHMNLYIPDLRGIGISVYKLEPDGVENAAAGSTNIMKYVQRTVQFIEVPESVDEAVSTSALKPAESSSEVSLRSTSGLDVSADIFLPSQVDESVICQLPANYQRKIRDALKKLQQKLEVDTIQEQFGSNCVRSEQSNKVSAQNRQNQNASEMADTSSDLTSCNEEPRFCGLTSYEDVKDALKNWVESVEEPLDEDCALVSDYMINLIQCCQMEKAYRLLQSFVRCVQNVKGEEWAAVYSKIVKPVQSIVIKKYGLPLNLPDTIM